MAKSIVLYKKYKASSNEVKTLSGEYVTNFGEWFKFMNNIDGIAQKSKEINCNYSDSMELVADENGIPVEVTLPLLSFYTDNEHYDFLKSTLDSILTDGLSEAKMITDYVSEDKASHAVSSGCPFDEKYNLPS